MKKLAVLFALLMPTFGHAKDYSAKELEAAASSFKLNGQWISPKIVKEFLPWQSDHAKPLVLAIDAAEATGSNRYFGEIKLAGPGKKSPTFTGEDGESVSYDWIGRLKNGMHVLVTREFGAGTMVSTELLVFSLTPNKSQLVLKIERLETLGDRAISEVKLDGNSIHVKTSFNGNRKSEEKQIQF